MLIIGHRGAAGLAPENTLSSIQAGIEAGADIIELDVRSTSDGELVLIHDSRLQRTHKSRLKIANLTYDELSKLTIENPVPKLTDILDQYFGKVVLNLEIKSRGTAIMLFELIQKHYIKKSSDWDSLIISSFKGYELVRLRRLSKRVNLAMLHNENPFIFVAYHRIVGFAAVGFHRLYLNSFALEIAKRSDLFIYTYTVDRVGAVRHLSELGLDGIVTNYPDKLSRAIEKL